MAVSIDEIYDALLENADFEEIRSLSKAQAFATAAKRFFILVPQSASDQGSSQSMSVAQIENLLNAARSFIAANDVLSGSGTRHLHPAGDFRG